VLPDTLPNPIEEPSLAADVEGNLRLAYTFVADFQAHLGNQRQLGTAAQTCLDIFCDWIYQLYRDSAGRAIHAEAPVLAVDRDGSGQLYYRALGFGADESGDTPSLPGDPIGIRVGTGELAQITTGFHSNSASPLYLSQDGQMNWQAAAVYDPLLDTTHVASVKGLVPQIGDASPAVTAPVATEGIAFTTQEQLPDFAVTAVEPATFYPEAESAFDVAVTVANEGVNWSGEEEGIEMALVATWDGPAGVGKAAGSTVVAQLLTGEAQTFTISVFSPPNPDVEHELYVTVNPLLEIGEQNVSNNSLSLILAGIPAPQNVSAWSKKGSSLVHLTWDPVDDPRVAGYRIYEQVEGGTLVPVGLTPTNGFLDLTAFFDVETVYAVRAFTENGSESPPAGTVAVTPGRLATWLPVISR
jgi:hypothetical protein